MGPSSATGSESGSTSLSRRGFARAGAATVTALTAAGYGRVRGANDRVGVGFIGFGLSRTREAVSPVRPSGDRPAPRDSCAQGHREGSRDRGREIFPRVA